MGGTQSSEIKIYYKDGRLIKETKTGNSVITESAEYNELDLVNFTEQDWEEIKNKPKVLDYCLLDNGANGLQECASLFRDSNLPTNPDGSPLNAESSYISALDQYRITKSNVSCLSYLYRPGGMPPKEAEPTLIRIFGNMVKGYKCQLEYQDYNYSDKDYMRCCYETNKTNCNANLVNDFTTQHCNGYMSNICKTNPTNPSCVRWLEQTTTRGDGAALEVYSEYCKKNHDKEICSYFCSTARKLKDYRSSFCDISLTEWCKNNVEDSRCDCITTPSNRIPETEEYLGPKECWLSSCVSVTDPKWLLTNQIETRQNCKLTACIVDIKSLVLNDQSAASIVNNCLTNSRTIKQIERNVNNKTNQIIETIFVPGFMLTPSIIILSCAVLALILSESRLKTIN